MLWTSLLYLVGCSVLLAKRSGRLVVTGVQVTSIVLTCASQADCSFALQLKTTTDGFLLLKTQTNTPPPTHTHKTNYKATPHF